MASAIMSFILNAVIVPKNKAVLNLKQYRLHCYVALSS